MLLSSMHIYIYTPIYAAKTFLMFMGNFLRVEDVFAALAIHGSLLILVSPLTQAPALGPRVVFLFKAV